VGVWGVGPFDNDTAGDMIAKMTDPIHRVLDLPIKQVPAKRPGKNRRKRRRPCASDYYCEARASASIILHAHGTDILGGPNLELVLQALKKMRADTEWLEIWRQGEGKRKPVRATDIAKALDRQIRAVQRKIRTCCHRRRVKGRKTPGRVLRRAQ
jgi:Domain of unknown function (DUF4259)